MNLIRQVNGPQAIYFLTADRPQILPQTAKVYTQTPIARLTHDPRDEVIVQEFTVGRPNMSHNTSSANLPVVPTQGPFHLNEGRRVGAILPRLMSVALAFQPAALTGTPAE